MQKKQQTFLLKKLGMDYIFSIYIRYEVYMGHKTAYWKLN